MSIVLVSGSRGFTDEAALAAALAELKPSVVYVGDARGCDALAARWCLGAEVEPVIFEANWLLGKRGGPVRNAAMVAA